MKSKLSVLFLLFLTGLLLASCQGSTTDINSIRQHTDPVAEQMFQALSNNDYNSFITPGSDSFKKAITPEEFKRLRDMSIGVYGPYTSKTYFTFQQNPDSIIVEYALQFTDKFKNPYTVVIEFEQQNALGPVSNFQLVGVKAR